MNLRGAYIHNTKRPEVEMGLTYADRLKNLTVLQQEIVDESKYIMRNGVAHLPQFPDINNKKYTPQS